MVGADSELDWELYCGKKYGLEGEKSGISDWLDNELSLLPDTDLAAGKSEEIEVLESGICTSLSGVLCRDTSASAMDSINKLKRKWKINS